MRIPLQVTARNLEMTDAIEAAVRKRAEKLEHFSDCITSCRVVVECPHRHHNKGLLYNIHIDLTLPGKELAITREPAEDMYLAIRDAFDVATRQVQTYMQKRNGQVKNHHREQPDQVAGF